MSNRQLLEIPHWAKLLPNLKILILSDNPGIVINSEDLPLTIEELYLNHCGLKVMPDLSRLLKLHTLILDENPMIEILQGFLPPNLKNISGAL